MTRTKSDRKHLKYVAGALREARDLMNSGGRHWIKGAERMLVDPDDHDPGDMGLRSPDDYYGPTDGLEPAYCSIGALHEIEADSLAALTLAEVIDPEGMRSRRDSLREEARAEYSYSSYYQGIYSEREFVEQYVDDRLAEDAEEVIVSFNDDTPTTWSDVRAAFTKAAKRLADRAR